MDRLQTNLLRSDDTSAKQVNQYSNPAEVVYGMLQDNYSELG